MSTKLKARQSELAIEIDAMQTNAAEKRFTITLTNTILNLLPMLDICYWTKTMVNSEAF